MMMMILRAPTLNAQPCECYTEIDPATCVNRPGVGDHPDLTWLMETMLEARRYRAYLTDEQAGRAAQWLGAQRALWNTALEHRQTACRQFGVRVSKVDQCRELTGLRAEVDWLRDVPAQSQQQLLADLDQAYQYWWAGTHRRPTWRKRGQGQGIRFPGQACGQPAKINCRWSTIRLPKLGAVKYRRDRPLGGVMRSVTLKRDRVGDWWISILVDTGVEPADPRTEGPVVGVDRGVAISAQASDDRSWQCPRPGRGEAQRRLRLERRLARQQKGSNRREKTRRQLAKVRRHDQRRRQDWAHKVSAELVVTAAVIGFEDLQVKNMTRSAKGTIDEPGRNVRQKAGLNREILASGWGQLVEFTKYKAVRVGATVVLVPAAFTSQRCACCGHVAPESRESQSRFRCVACNHTDNADVNAAINIATAAGRVVAGRGDPPGRGVDEASTILVAA